MILRPLISWIPKTYFIVRQNTANNDLFSWIRKKNLWTTYKFNFTGQLIQHIAGFSFRNGHAVMYFSIAILYQTMFCSRIVKTLFLSCNKKFVSGLELLSIFFVISSNLDINTHIIIQFNSLVFTTTTCRRNEVLRWFWKHNCRTFNISLVAIF